MNRHESGLSYIEVMVAVLFLSVALVPMMNSFAPGIQGSTEHRQSAEKHYVLRGAMETVMAESFFDLDAAATEAGDHETATLYSDPDAAVPYVVYIWRYDADNADGDNDPFTGGENDLLWIRVEIVNGTHSLQTLRSSY